VKLSSLLYRYFPGRADAQLLALVEMNVLAALAEDSGGSNSGPYGRANRGPNSTARDRSDDRANAGRGADFFNILLG